MGPQIRGQQQGSNKAVLPRVPSPNDLSYPVPTERADTTLLDAWKQAFEEHGYGYADELVSEGATIGTRPYTATIDPVSGHRSSAANGYGAIIASRANVRIVTGASVTRILFDSSAPHCHGSRGPDRSPGDRPIQTHQRGDHGCGRV
ncbi:unnamed protein product [Aspergillus oryzae]|nr:unnamed protein product [Aspergillus oryzae]GMF85148.1 unnamed protein product [Aspergillus oryzae]